MVEQTKEEKKFYEEQAKAEEVHKSALRATGDISQSVVTSSPDEVFDKPSTIKPVNVSDAPLGDPNPDYDRITHLQVELETTDGDTVTLHLLPGGATTWVMNA